MDSKNKNGFIFTTGIVAILALLTLIIIGGVLFFISVNKFAIIGGGLIAITLLSGLKGNFSREKSVFMLITIFLGLFFILGGGMLQTQFGPAPTHVFIDASLGMVTTTVQSPLNEQAYFKTLSGNGISVSTVGDTIKVCDFFAPLPNDFRAEAYVWSTEKNGNDISNQDMTSLANSYSGKQYCKSWTPTSAGKYEVISFYEYCPDIVGPVYTPDCLFGRSDDTKSYFLTVKAEEDRCDKDRYVGDWYIHENIPGGKVLRANVYYVDNDCKYYVERYSTQTQCVDGYLIEGSNLHSTEGDGWDCVLKEVISEDPEDDTSYEDPTEDENCNTNLMVTCADGTEIMDKLCEEGMLLDTGAKCSEIGVPREEDPETGETVDPVTGDEVDPVTGEYTESMFMQKYGNILVSLTIVFALIIIIAIWRKRK